MRYLITGGAGFIGSHLADALIARGDEVIALDDLSTGRGENVAHLERKSGFRLVHGSVLDERKVDELVEDCDVVAHLAAAVGVELIVKRPLQSLTTNIRGAEIVLGAAQAHARKVLVTSSSEIYGKNLNGPLREDADRLLGSPTVARWAYSTSKAVDEILAYAYHKERGLESIVVRLFNTVGPRQTGAYGMVLPRFASQAVAGDPLTVYGDGTQSRCFCHVSDVVDALIGLLDSPDAVGEVFNVGSDEEVSICDLARRVISAAGSASEIRLIPYDVAFEQGFEDMLRRRPDTSKIRELTGWRPKTTLDRIVSEVVAEALDAKTS
jgi:UDP-glucose 4-epimerase